MTALRHTKVVFCPYARAKTYLAQALEELADRSAPQTLTLRVPLPGGELAKDVVVRYGRAADPRHFDQPWTVHWTPKGGGPYPDFDGTLTVRSDERYSSSILELDGSYRPPFGSVGQLFDEAVGVHIAESTANVLLSEIAARMEARYRAEESQKGP
jgi:hypothetical protein